jgi:O-methyltransferase
MNYAIDTFLHYSGMIIRVIFPFFRFLGIEKSLRTRFTDTIAHSLSQGFTPANRCVPDVLRKAFDYAKKTGVLYKGDYFEFGIAKGYTIWYAQTLLNKFGSPNMHCWGFDSFQGLPKPIGLDDTGEFYEGQFACSKKTVERSIVSHDGNLKYITLIEGFYQDSLKPGLIKRYKMQKVAICLIDCDLYASTVDVLEFIRGILIPGSILLFDDWNAFSSHGGEQKALKEYLAKYPKTILRPLFSFCWHGQAFEVVSL